MFQPPVRTSATRHQALAIGRHLFETEAGDPAQFQHHAFEHDAETLADQAMIRVAQFERRRDADRPQPFGQAAGDAPQVGKFEAAESVPLSLFAEEKANPAGGGVLLRQAIGHLGQRLRRRNSDRDRNPGPLLHRASQIARMCLTPGFEPDQAQERFVDRIDFEVGREVG